MKTLKGPHPKTSAKINKKFGRAIKKLGETDMKKETFLEEWNRKKKEEFALTESLLRHLIAEGYYMGKNQAKTPYSYTLATNIAEKEWKEIWAWVEQSNKALLSAERKRVGEVIDGKNIKPHHVKDLDKCGSEKGFELYDQFNKQPIDTNFLYPMEFAYNQALKEIKQALC